MCFSACGILARVSNGEDLPDDKSLPSGDDSPPGYDEPGDDADESEAGDIATVAP